MLFYLDNVESMGAQSTSGIKVTTDLRAVLKGILQDHLRADERALAQNVFPGSAGVTPMAGLTG